MGTWVLDELLPAAFSVSIAATELLPQSAATAVVQPAAAALRPISSPLVVPTLRGSSAGFSLRRA